MIPDTWSFDPAAVGLAVLALALYTRGFHELRRRGRPDHASTANALLFTVGIAAGVLAVVSPLDALADDTLLSAHMLQHLVIGDLVPLLLVLGLRGPIAFFLLPPAVLRPLAHSAPLRRVLTFVLRPGISLAGWAAVIAVWHVPAVYDAALASPGLHRVEHASLFLAGLVLWLQIVDPARRHTLSDGGRAALALLALVAGMALSEILFAAAPLYDHYANVADRPFGLTRASDQTRAALVMTLEQVATLGCAAALLFWRHTGRLARESGQPIPGTPPSR